MRRFVYRGEAYVRSQVDCLAWNIVVDHVDEWHDDFDVWVNTRYTAAMLVQGYRHDDGFYGQLLSDFAASMMDRSEEVVLTGICIGLVDVEEMHEEVE